MPQYLLVFAASLVLVLGATPLVRRLAYRFGVVDAPNARKIHLNPIPLLGGIAIYVAFIIALVGFGGLAKAASGSGYVFWQTVSILLGATVLAVVGAFDDKWGLTPKAKLLAQGVAAIGLIATGIRVDFLHLFSGDLTWVNGLANNVVTVIWVVGITNALNLMDNMDGLAGGVAAIASSFFFALAVFNDQTYVAPLAAALAGACLGFLFYNFKPQGPASIFMGDAGSMFLGFTLAVIGIIVRFPLKPNGTDFTWLVPILVLGVPIFDTTLVTISRRRRGISIFTAGKDHFSHRLVRLGLSHQQAVMLIYLVATALGAVGLAVFWMGPLVGRILAVVAVVCAGAGLWRLEQVPLDKRATPESEH